MMKFSMFHSAALKLTLWYLALVMVLSVGFSFVLYRLASGELNREWHRPPPAYRVVPQALDRWDIYRDETLTLARNNIKRNLVLFNAATLVLGGLASYALARRTLEPIEEAMEAQGRFTADASHELRTPLTAMQTEIEVALRHGSLSREEANALLRSNLEEVGKLRQLADGLLLLARTDNDAIATDELDLTKIVGDALARVKPAAAAKHITLENKTGPLKLRGNGSNLSELLVILLDNAVKYSPVRSIVTLTAKKQGKNIVLAVRDEGAGIEARDLPHIFDRFYRAEKSRARSGRDGYGLGLSIAKRIVDMHHGSIRVASKPGKGSTFTVRLPA